MGAFRTGPEIRNSKFETRFRIDFQVSIFEFRVFQAVPQRLTLQQLHHNEGLSLVLFHLMNSADVGMVQGGGRAGFALEAL